MTKEIPLGRYKGGSGMVALVDDCDFEMLMNYSKTWCFHKHQKRCFCQKNGVYTLMYRVIMNPPKGMEVDHINGNALDNRRTNLRVCTSSQNAKNKDRSSLNTTGFKGVVCRAHNNKKPYTASIKSDGKFHHLGYYPTPEAAAAAYNEAAKRLHGEFARLNVIPQTR